jgi:hypothetical protein
LLLQIGSVERSRSVSEMRCQRPSRCIHQVGEGRLLRPVGPSSGVEGFTRKCAGAVRLSGRYLLRLSRSCIHISAREPPWFSLSSSAPRTTPSSQAGERIERNRRNSADSGTPASDSAGQQGRRDGAGVGLSYSLQSRVG